MSSQAGRPPVWSYWLVLPLFIVFWGLFAWHLESPLLPGPLQVLETLMKEARGGQLWFHLGATLARVAVAFTLAMLLGTCIGIVMGRSRTANALFDPMLVLLLNLPALVTIILMYVWFGLVEAAAVMAVVINKIPNVDRLAGTELGGIPLVSAAAIATGKPAILIRNQKKGYGTAKQLEGAINEGETVVLVEDIATTGGQVLEAGHMLRDEFNVNVPTIIATIDREEGARENIEAAGFAFDSLFTKSDLGIDE